MASILLVEDELSNQRIVGACLAQHEIVMASTLKDARRFIAEKSFDLIILDVQLPDGDGFSFLVELQSLPATQNTTTVMLTGKTESSDKVTGYSLGADDYITKPIDTVVFKARIEAKLRKRDIQKDQEAVFKKDGFTFSLDKQSVTFESSEGKKLIEMTALEFKMFLYLIKNKDRVFSREDLISAVWSDNLNISDRTVDSHMSHLRKHLAGSSLKVQAVYGAGYKLTDSKSK